MKIILADDHTLFRDALAQFIVRAEPEAKVRQAQDMQDVMSLLEDGGHYDLVLLDLRMPGMDGLQGLAKVRELYPDIAVALLSGLAEKSHVLQAVEMGAVGFFPKTMSGKAMLGGIHRILKGESFVAIDHNTNDIMASYRYGESGGQDRTGSGTGGGTARGMAENKQAGYLAALPDGPALTPREKEVLSYLMKGASNKDIARALELQVVTIKLHVRGICRKLGARNRTQAALKAQQMGLLESQ